jgi:hypothetical protein
LRALVSYWQESVYNGEVFMCGFLEDRLTRL